MNAKLLVVDDEPLILELIRCGLEPYGVELFCVSRAQEALALFEEQPIDLAILDYSLPDVCGAELFHQLRALRPELPVIFLTGHPNLEAAVSLMKSGARDYLTKPFSTEELYALVCKILQQERHLPPPPQVKAVGARPSKAYLFGQSEAMRSVEAQVQNLSRYLNTTVLITGPTGTGKSAVARRLHELSWGSGAPFVEIDCSTIPRELCESELFGHEKGAFTGAHRTKQGLFEAAGQGTAFLDEIGELELALQAKFLRVLEARHFKRVGGHSTLPMNARIIAATNRSLPELVSAGLFREDLYFRLNVLELWMPPLKERGEDVLMLAEHFLEHFATHYAKHIRGFSPEALCFIGNCDFPGNVRELRNMIERAVVNSTTDKIQFAQLVALQRPTLRRSCLAEERAVGSAELELAEELLEPAPALSFNLAELQRRKLREALEVAQGNKSKAAKLLGLSRTAFHRRLSKLQLQEAQPVG